MKPLWTPSVERMQQANITRFTQWLAKREQTNFENYAELHAWSCTHKEKFWPAVWEFAQLIQQQPWQDVYIPGKEFFTGHWFPGMRLNFAENLLRFRDEQTAIIFCSEDKRYAELTYAQLYAKVAEVAATLRAQGIKVGDRVAGILPNIPETIIAMLATTSMGAIWSSCSPDFGTTALVDRLGQLQPKVLFTTDGYVFKGKVFNILSKIQEVQKALPDLSHTVVIPYLTGSVDIAVLTRASIWGDFLQPSVDLDFVSLPFDHPAYILFSSGTTGKPKCIVHSAGGTLLQHVKELQLHTDIKREDRFLFYTTCGWMMWNWMVSGLALGTTLVLYEGAPIFPRPNCLLQLIEQYNITVFGASAAYFSALAALNVRAENLPSLKTILSTGSPLLPEQFDYIYANIKEDVCLSSISGGTDIISCFVLGNPTLPVYRGQCQCRGLGMAVQIVNDQGEALLNEQGELVCTVPFPSMPIGFWQDENNERYRQSYFATIPSIWWHGDFAKLTEEGGVIMLGRSDAVLNPGGVRIGTAEIYRPLINFPVIIDSLVIGQCWEDSERIILFVKLQEGEILNEDLLKNIREIIRVQASPRHVPAKIIQVIDIPRTLNGKLAELTVKNVIHHQQVKNREALANPESLKYFENLQELNT
ncbi:MAG: acetoacetate--CoA ligase [Gammaproteobacteria bacterium]